jgi:hypothetical protein
MFSRISRWSWLLIFAACNLLFWVAVAVAVGLVVSDEVDLGVETLIRERQATVAVVVVQSVAKASLRTPEADTPTKGPAPPETEVVASRPTVTTVLPPASTPLPTPRVERTPALLPTLTPALLPTPIQPVPQPEATPVSSPLLMSDAEFSNLAHMDQEMARSAAGRPVQIRYSEEALNQEVETLLQRSPNLPYRNVKVDLKRDQVVVTAEVTVVGFEVGAEVLGTVVVRDCQPQMEVQAVSIAGVLTPGFVEEQIKEMLLEAMDWYPADYPLCLEQIVLEEERATIYGYRR